MKQTINQYIDRVKAAQGLGDVVKATTSAVGIKPCSPCQKRAEKLNRMVPFKKNGPGR